MSDKEPLPDGETVQQLTKQHYSPYQEYFPKT